MAEMKFSCPQCGQHIGYNEAWSGLPIECPACHGNIIVPQVQRPPTAFAASAPASEPAKPASPKLAAGVTQVPRSTAHAPAPAKKFIPQRHGSDNALLKYGVMVAVVAALAGAGYFYGLPLITNAFQQTSAGSSSANPSQSGGGLGGPMGEVNGAMDVSETLDSGSSSSGTRPRPVPSTNNAARPRPAKPPH